MFRRQFIAHLGQFLGAGFVLPNPVNTRQKLHASEVISVVSTPLEQLIQPESVIVNKATGQAAWYYRGHLYLLKPTGRIHPNSPLECDISTVDKIPGTYRHSTRGWIMSDDWRNLVDVQKQIPDFDINNFVSQNFARDWLSIQPESVIVNKATGQAAWYYRGHLYLLKPTGRIHPNSPLECDISTVDKIPGTYRHSTRGWIMSDDWRNLVDVQKQIPDFDINNFVIRSKS